MKHIPSLSPVVSDGYLVFRCHVSIVPAAKA